MGWKHPQHRAGYLHTAAMRLPTSDLLRDTESFRDFEYSVEAAAKNRAKMSVVDWVDANLKATADPTPIQKMLTKKLSDPAIRQVSFTRHRDFHNISMKEALSRGDAFRPSISRHTEQAFFGESGSDEWKPASIDSKLADALDQMRRQIEEVANKPTTPADVMFAVDAEDKVTMFAVPQGRRIGIYFETEAAMRAFRDRLDDTGIAPLPRYAMPEPVSDRIELEHGLPLIVADEIIWKMITTRDPRVIDIWLNPPAYEIVTMDGVDVFAPTFAPMPDRREVAGDLAIKIGDRVVINSALDDTGTAHIVVGFPHYSDNDDIVVAVPENGNGRHWTVNRANVLFGGHDLKKALERRAFYERAKPGYLRKEPIDG